MTKKFRVGIDVGGTFTDFVVFDQIAGTTRIHKVRTTPDDPSRGILQGTAEIGLAPGDVDGIAHGTTTATNALIERRGAEVAFLTTMGFRDTLEVRRAGRQEMYDAQWSPPPPLVPRRNRITVNERIRWNGEVVVPLDEVEVDGVVNALRARGIQSVAICFLHSYLHPGHEERVRDLLKKALPGVFVTISSECSQEYREFERGSTVAANAYVGPPVQRYMRNLKSGLENAGFDSDISIMQSNGGVCTIDESGRLPVKLARSGPAGGAMALQSLAAIAGIPRMVGIDIGGTSADVSVVVDGRARWTSPLNVEWGLPLLFPSVNVVSIGSGGGSVAWIDQGGALHMGPESAAAVPGPACYGRGGTRPTTTDAHAVLGIVGEDRFAHGALHLRRDLAEAAIKEAVAQPLDISVEDAADGMLRILDNLMLQAIRFVTLEKGYDPREFALVGFGGGGPMHVVSLARELGIDTAVVPVAPGVFSAWGILTVDMTQDQARTILQRQDLIGEGELSQMFSALRDDVAGQFDRQGLDSSVLDYEFFLDMQYLGQVHPMPIPLYPESGTQGGEALIISPGSVADVLERFHAEHAREYGHSDANQPIQFVHARVFGRFSVTKLNLTKQPDTGADPAGALVGTRRVRLGSAQVMACLYDRELLGPGMEIDGPALIQEESSTTVLPTAARLRVDDYGNLVINTGISSPT